MVIFPSTGMCLYMTLNQHTLVQGKTVTFQNMQVITMYIFLRYNGSPSQHRHVLICDIESAHTGTRQDSDISKYAGPINVYLFEL